MPLASKHSEGIVWLKLSKQSIQKLKNAFPPNYPNTFYDHVTLVFGTQRNLFEDIIGDSATIVVYAYAKNHQVEAARVQHDGLPDTYGVPHITLSTQLGIKPFASVRMLQEDHYEKTVSPLELEGVIEFVTL